MAFLAFQCVVFAAVGILYSSGSTSRMLKAEKDILDRILNSGTYDPRIRPTGTNGIGPVIVRTNMFIRKIGEIDDTKMEYSIQLTFRQSWMDGRLSYNTSDGHDRIRYLTLTDTDRIWKPDLFFSNEQNGHLHNILQPNVLIRISPDGGILFSIRISLQLSCPMDLHSYPLDSQTCSIVMASYAYTTEDIVFLWKEGDPLQVTKSLFLPQFTLNSFLTDYCTSKTNTGEYSCMKVNLSFSRQFSYYFFQMYVPNSIVVILSWAAFWLDRRATTARIAIWVTTLLTLVIEVRTNRKLPAVSYNKAIDIWSGVCFMFLYAVLVELAIVAHVVIMEDRRKAADEGDADDSMLKKPIMSHGDGAAENRAGSSSRSSMLNRFLRRYPSRSERIDIVSRFFFPIIFAFFNLIYWSTYYRNDNMGGTKYV